MTAEDFQNIIKKKKDRTNNLLGVFDGASDFAKQDLAEKYKEGTESSHYKNDYVAVNCYDGVNYKPVLNNLVMVNEIRAFKIQQIDYADRFTVFSTVHNKLTKDDIINQEALKFMEEYNSLTEARKKLILLCESSLSGKLSKEAVEIVVGQIPDSDYIKSYYTTLGPERLRALGYKRSTIEKELGIVTFSPGRLMVEIYSNFHPGEKYTLANLKAKLAYIYNNINYEATPKASDIEDWFEVREILISEKKPDGGRKRIRAYELVGPKNNNSQGDV